MKVNLDDQLFKLSCPSCGKKFEERIGRLKNNPDIPCPGCTTIIRINADQLRQRIKVVEHSLAEFKRGLGKAFK